MTRTAFAASAVVALVATLVTVVPAASAAPAPEWKLCKEIANGWPAGDARTECATVAVPVDHAKPDGRKIKIAISRITASEPAARRGVMVFNPGGPGGSGISMPPSMLQSTVKDIGRTHDLIGFDPRGVGYSDKMTCPVLPGDTEQPPASWSVKEKARFISARNGKANRRCAETDLEFARNLTTDAIARDIDAIRAALGEKKINYYGISWGTALGAHYRSLFDGNVDRMLLDSVMLANFDLNEIDNTTVAANENLFNDFVSWIARYDRVYRFGTTHGEVSKALFDLRKLLTESPRVVGSGPSQTVIDGETITNLITQNRSWWSAAAAELVKIRDNDVPERARQAATAAGDRAAARSASRGFEGRPEFFSRFLNVAVICNEALSTRDFETAWGHRMGRIAKYPAAGESASFDGMCANWPLPVQPWRLKSGASALQLVGHLYEGVTPIDWAVSMRAKIGGALFTIEDDWHGSLSRLPCGATGVEFFATGKASTASCTGAPIPTPETAAPSSGDGLTVERSPYDKERVATFG
ncbi:alpha/beta hydrolase [Allokutzneria sp. A3M-2-11 16]|uniref:alpha/beta fold hydrolase n=1 Tax=Allokutzneria sp. A3M-2-11 16 TaxID=2962043 RepID=UPI0020B643A3|nr:alpha/beta fold hydrolase [Allokutzneria sp. A3M-2-11 16]MCP3803121.1 alpha/beta hydrolase [Allokutzneria sp. A3M-2-11 16]